MLFELIQLGGGKKTASELLFEEKSFSASGATLKAACSTCGDSAFHTDVFPARFVKIGLPQRNESRRLFQVFLLFRDPKSDATNSSSSFLRFYYESSEVAIMEKPRWQGKKTIEKWREFTWEW